MMGYGNVGMMGFLWPLMMLGMAAIYVILLLALWRIMRAHENLAEAVKDLADRFKPGP